MVRLIHAGDWPESTLTTERVPSARRIEPAVEQAIEHAWATALDTPGIHLFDGPMCRLESVSATAASLHLRYSPCSYRLFLGTNMANTQFHETFGPGVMANPLGLSAAVVTADGKVLLGRRNESMAYYPGRVHPIAGSLEPSDASPFAGIRRELREELHLQDCDVQSIACIGLVEDAALFQPELIFTAAVTKSAEALARSVDAIEHRGLWTCPADFESIENELAGDTAFTPVAEATLLLSAGRQFGPTALGALARRLIARGRLHYDEVR